MQLTKEQVEAIFAEVRPHIVEEMKKSMLASVEWQARESTREAVAKEVQEFISSEVVPDLRIRLAESKDGIISACIPAAEGIATELSKALLETLTKNLAASSYKRGAIFKALFE